jgi:hypothetical protein
MDDDYGFGIMNMSTCQECEKDIRVDVYEAAESSEGVC